jgi:hypothetical protein
MNNININYKDKYLKYKVKYLKLKKNNQEGGGLFSTKYKRGMCVTRLKGDPYFNYTTKISHVSGTDKKTSYIILEDTSQIDLQFFENYYTKVKCPEKNSKYGYSNDNILLYVDSNGRFFNVNANVIKKDDIQKIYIIDTISNNINNNIMVKIIKINNETGKLLSEELNLTPEELKRDYYIVRPEFKHPSNVPYDLKSYEEMQIELGKY